MSNIKKTRDSNIEMLRIIAMFFILFHHYALYNSLYNLEVGNVNKYIGILLFSLGKIGVNIFILITEYFVKSPLLIVQAVVSIIVIFFIGSCIDLIRQNVIEKRIMKIKKFDNFFDKIDKLFND